MWVMKPHEAVACMWVMKPHQTGVRDFDAKMQIVLAVAAMDLKIEAEHTCRKLVSITKGTSNKAHADLNKGETCCSKHQLLAAVRCLGVSVS